jgi:hypothetical protein
LLHHHGAKHDVWVNPVNLNISVVPRHPTIKRGRLGRFANNFGSPNPQVCKRGLREVGGVGDDHSAVADHQYTPDAVPWVRCDRVWIETLSAKARVNPFFERAGFRMTEVNDAIDPYRYSEPGY